MITLTTPRLRLSGFNASDWPFFLRLRRDPEVMRYMGELLEEPALRTLFESRCADPGVFVLRDASGAAIGDIGLRISSKNPHEADVGYALLPEAQGKGYASEALKAICDYGFQQLAFTPSMPGCWAVTLVPLVCWKNTVLSAFRCSKKPIA